MKKLLSILAILLYAAGGISFAADEVKPGLIGEYFDMAGAVEDFPALAADKKPTIKKVDKQVNVESVEENFNGTNLGQHFYIRWTGQVKIEKAGKYKFYTESDDGSRLFIDGKQLVDNSGLHAMQKKDGEVELTAGTHELKLEYFQNEGGAGCKLSWSADGIPEDIIPEKVLWHKADAEK
jgi:hypothetical protein